MRFSYYIFMLSYKVNIILRRAGFSYKRLLVVFYWNPSDSKSPRLFRVFLADLNNTVVSMVSILPLISIFFLSFYLAFGDRSKRKNYS